MMSPRRVSVIGNIISFFIFAIFVAICSAQSQSKELRKLSAESLIAAGFNRAGVWSQAGDGRLSSSASLPDHDGVYAFVIGGDVQYIGLATVSLRRRLYFYGRPGKSQSTNIRINSKIREVLGRGEAVEIYIASPPDFDWNGLPVDGDAGLEEGLIRHFMPPWNIKNASAD